MKKFVRIMAINFIALALLVTNGLSFVNAQERENIKRSVYSVDAGRKYFSEDQLKQIIDKAYTNGYTTVQLLLGNDGLRFVLDDMDMVVDGISYDGVEIKKGISLGNKKYYDDPNGDVLYEDEMDRIIEYALERGIDIIPGINSPGHMDAILVAMEHVGIENVRYVNGSKVSDRTVNIENKHAITFVQQLVKKYADYFGNSGVSEIFNFGADEYANDVFSSPGWGELQRLGLYDDFVDYVNELSRIIKDAGMLPMSFNDGIYYNSKDEYGTFDKDIIISYWTAGWWGFYVAKPEFFASKGHDIINTNDAWYWVLGNISENIYNYNSSYENIGKVDFNVIPGGSTIETIGIVQAFWADDPSKDHDLDRMFTLMDTYSAKHSDKLIKPADYTKVDELLLTVPSDLTVYTDETVTTLNNSINAITRNLRHTDQDLVDQMALNLETSIDSLVLQTVTTDLEDEINKSKDVKASEYTVESYKAYESALENARLILAKDDATQEEIDQALQALKLAYGNLKLNDDKVTDEKPDATTPEDEESKGGNVLGEHLPATGAPQPLLIASLSSFLVAALLLLKKKFENN